MSDYLNPSKEHGDVMCYSGSKHRYALEIKDILPKNASLSCCDVFCGGGSITTALPTEWDVVGNDVESRIIDIHKYFQEMLEISSIAEVFTYIREYCHSQVRDRTDKDGFNKLKQKYNTYKKPIDLYALATSSNSNYIRFNKSGEFNINFGERWLNPSLQKKLYNYLIRISHRNMEWVSKDFRDIDFNKFDFLIVDPPYAFNGKSTATYNERGGWQLPDLINLLSKLDKYHEQGGKFIFFNEIITKNQDNPIIQEWVNKYTCKVMKDTLSGCSYQRADKRSVEVMCWNY